MWQRCVRLPRSSHFFFFNCTETFHFCQKVLKKAPEKLQNSGKISISRHLWLSYWVSQPLRFNTIQLSLTLTVRSASYKMDCLSTAVLPQSAAGQILPKYGYYAGTLFLKIRVRSILTVGIWMLNASFMRICQIYQADLFVIYSYKLCIWSIYLRKTRRGRPRW